MATHSSILALGIPWTEEPGRLQSMESQRVVRDWATKQTAQTKPHPQAPFCGHSFHAFLSHQEKEKRSDDQRGHEPTPWPQVWSALDWQCPESTATPAFPLFCFLILVSWRPVPDFLGAPDTHCSLVSQAHLPSLFQELSASCKVLSTDLGWLSATSTIARGALPPTPRWRGWWWPLFLWTVPDDGSYPPYHPYPPQGSPAASSQYRERAPALQPACLQPACTCTHTDTGTHTPSPPAQGARRVKIWNRQTYTYTQAHRHTFPTSPGSLGQTGSIRWDRWVVLCGFPASISPGSRATFSLMFISSWLVALGLWSETFGRCIFSSWAQDNKLILWLVYPKGKSNWDPSWVHWLSEKKKRTWEMWTMGYDKSKLWFPSN